MTHIAQTHLQGDHCLAEEAEGKVMDWPSVSPDLNPIERLWDILKWKVEECKVSNIHQLCDVIMEDACHIRHRGDARGRGIREGGRSEGTGLPRCGRVCRKENEEQTMGAAATWKVFKDTALDPGEDVALLSVSFEDAEATQVFPKLYLSPSIEHALGGSSALHIPAFPSGGCLIDYVPQVCQLLTNKVQYVIQGYHKRREYIAAFLSYFGMGVVEYDAEGFTKLTLLLMWKDFCFLVHVDLPLYFPRDQPTLTFQSVYHFTNSGQLYSQVQKSYPYSPRWDGNEMAKRAKAYFKTFVPQFQEGAFANGKL
ncbi:BRISC and BRCA1-A complex member 2-like [Gouania willdenowi]|uniref:BRISC and BRCA1-A complex member 2-like n=1 Tax=Gouania willdenowi TaxID=441366 RepID=UPI0010568D30|nr:BRISC and BRCA1-A complex member 2-like [Gouania willdenowi]